jgi:dATP pyrophosphohydrolase
MSVRAPFQVLIFPYRLTRQADLRYAIFRRADDGAWQGIAGGGHVGESPEDAARREAQEEAGIPGTAPLLRLRSVGQIPADVFAAHLQWNPGITHIPEYAFGIAVTTENLVLSAEHSASEWLDANAALERLEWDSNRLALRELHERLSGTSL